MQKILMTFSSNAKHIVIKKISFTHFFKSIATEKSIVSALIFLKENLMFDTALEVTDQMIKKLTQAAAENIF